jgi:capsular exopolysaccharide synthesis family protein
MRKALRYYTLLLKRWAWLILLGVVLCSGAGFIISKLTTPVYQASATLVVNMKSATSAFDNVSTSIQAVPTYASLITDPSVLNPVVAQHPGLTLQALNQMLQVNPQSNSQLIEVDVQNTNPVLATQLANEISRSFQAFANSQLSGDVEVLPAQQPVVPIRPHALEYTASGAAIGLCLALALIVIFEWMDDHFSSPDAVQKLLDMEILGMIPLLSKKRRRVSRVWNRALLTQRCRQIAANLDIAQRIIQPFKLLMVTSALAGEGKTTVAAKVAISLAEAGKQVLLVEANLHNPTLDRFLDLKRESGSARSGTEYMQQREANLSGQITLTPNLRVLSASLLLSQSSGSSQPQWSSQLFESLKAAPFNYVIFDAPALLSAVDARVLASHVEAIVLVIDASKTAREAAVQARHMLERLEAITLGVVINKSPWSEQWRATAGYAIASSGLARRTAPISRPLSNSFADAPTQRLVKPNTTSPFPDQKETMSKK